MKLRLTAPCHFGLEKTLAFELKKAGGENLTTTDGRIFFDGDEQVIARANITSRIAERIGIVLAEFEAKTFDDVFIYAGQIPIESFVGRNDKFPVTKGHSLNSVLTSIPALQRTLKKALALRMSAKYNTANLPETGKTYPINFLLMKNKMTVIMDTSGDGLHKRGYRALSNAAPIKETLAAGIVDLARVRITDTVVDPFCGSGTMLIEAAEKALNIAPGINRDFLAMNYDFIDKKIWEEEREKARSEIKNEEFYAFGYDIDFEAVELSKSNAWKAGVAKNIVIEKRDIKDFSFPKTPAKIITNPPYAQRMMSEDEVYLVYKTFGERVLPLTENQIFVISGCADFEKFFGEKAAKNRKLYNGMTEARVYMYY